MPRAGQTGILLVGDNICYPGGLGRYLVLAVVRSTQSHFPLSCLKHAQEQGLLFQPLTRKNAVVCAIPWRLRKPRCPEIHHGDATILGAEIEPCSTLVWWNVWLIGVMIYDIRTASRPEEQEKLVCCAHKPPRALCSRGGAASPRARGTRTLPWPVASSIRWLWVEIERPGVLRGSKSIVGQPDVDPVSKMNVCAHGRRCYLS
ncbi:hypothetical protein V8C37DRAFT_234407 [Trichoderma ceciliae]